MFSILRSIWLTFLHIFHKSETVEYPEVKPYLAPRYRGRIVLTLDAEKKERCVACYLCAAVCPVDCISLQAAEDESERRYPEFFRINFSRCIFCGFCEEACPTYAIQLIPDFEMGEYDRQNMVYEKKYLLISGEGKYPGYNFYKNAGVDIGAEGKGEGENEEIPVDIKDLCLNYYLKKMNVFFYIAASVAIISTIMAISGRNAIHSLLYLILSLLAVSVIYYLLDAPFIAALEVIIYAGAIMVLFIFVTMMLNIGLEREAEKKWLNTKMWIIPSILAAILLIDLILSLKTAETIPADNQIILPKQVGISLFSTYLLAVEIAAILLMAGVIGAYHLGSQKKKVTHRFLKKK